MKLYDFLKHCVAYGGNWTAMLMIGIKNVFPDYFEKMEDRPYSFDELLDIIESLGVDLSGEEDE